jgi:ABC-type multidrug transport system ATPase subunit
MVEKLCSRVVILSKGRIAAERDMDVFRDGRAESLEDVFVHITGQDDFTPVARQILELMQP